jgi:LmbE family N-acetylglucosaminyl deacetylase
MSMTDMLSPEFTPILYPNLKIEHKAILFLGCPIREVDGALAGILSLCTGTNTINEIRSVIPEAQSQFLFETLEQLGYIVFPQKFPPPGKAIPESKILIISPHMDDAFLSIGGTILTWRNCKSVDVIDVFGFDPWLKLRLNRQTSETQKNIWRQREELFNAELCGCRVEFWRYQGALSRGYAEWNANLDLARDKDLRANIAFRILERVREQRYKQILFPLGVGGHTDHQLIREIGAHLAPSLINEGVENIYFYEDLPYATETSNWIEWCRRSGPKDMVGYPLLYVDITAQIQNKKSLIQTYSSQLLFYEPYTIISYQQKNRMLTSVSIIDTIHNQYLDEVGNFNERLWLYKLDEINQL